MNAKWCVSTLFIILALLGLSQEQNKVSNQQILLQFADVDLQTAPDAILSVITQKLELLGAGSIEIIENDGTQVSIRYYSNVDALIVKAFLSDKNKFPLSNGEEFPSDYPKDELPENYSLVVTDLHQQTDDSITLSGTLILVQKQEIKTFSNSLVRPFFSTLGCEQEMATAVAYRINKNSAKAIDNTSRTIPEVRAGPYFYGNS
jgi:hypothetical protein